jgi:hypothetical protein
MRLSICFTVLVVASLAAVAAAVKSFAVGPTKASLAAGLEDWIVLMEKDDANLAASRWTKDAQTAKDLKQYWASLRECHKNFNYRNWLDKQGEGGGATKIADARSFKVGGHDFGHMHIHWEKTANGWRIGRVWMCR